MFKQIGIILLSTLFGSVIGLAVTKSFEMPLIWNNPFPFITFGFFVVGNLASGLYTLLNSESNT